MAIEWNKPVRKLKWKVRQLDINTRTTIQDITADNFEFEVQRVAEDSKFFGQVVCQKLNLKLREVGDNPYSTENYWKLYFREGSGSFEGKFPWFYTTEVHTDENTGMKSITAYDWIKRLENHTFTELNINPPYTIRQVAEAITHFDYATRETLFINIDSATLNLNYPQGANFHGEEKLTDILAMIAEVLGAVCFVNVDNKLVFKRLDKSGEPVLEITKNDYFTFKSGENKRLAKIIYATELGDNVEAHTTALGSTQACRNNAFLDNRSDRMALVSSAINNYGGLTIGQVDLDWRANPDLEIGDKIAITAKDDTTITTYLLDEVVKWKNGLSSKMRFKWDQSKESDESANPATIGDAFNSTYAKVDKINNTIELVVAEQEETSQELSGVKDDLTSTQTQVNTNKNNIASLTLTTSGLELNVQNLENKTETIETTISNISVGGRNLFIAHTRRNNKSIHPDTGLDNSWGHGFASDFMPVEAGVSYIIQFWQIPKPEAQSEGISWGLYFYDTDKNWISPRYARVISEKTYDTFTRKAPTGACYARFYWHIGGNFDATKWNPYGDYQVKFERGTKPTDWSIAPEDQQYDLETTKTQVETNKTNIANLSVTTEGISADVENLESRVETTETDISTVQSGLNTTNQNLTSTQSQVATNKQDIANLSVTAQGISANVSNLQTTTNTLTTTVANISTDLDKTKDRNLFLNSKKERSFKNTTTSYILSNYGQAVVLNGIKVTISFDAKSSEDGNKIDIYPRYNPDSPTSHSTSANKYAFALTTSYNHYSFSMTMPTVSYPWYCWLFRSNTNTTGGSTTATIYVKNAKCELGAVETPYQEAPEDLSNEVTTVKTDLATTQTQVQTNKEDIASLEVTTNGISQTVSNHTSTINSMNTTLTSVQTTANNANSKANSLETSLNSVSSQVTTNKNNIATLQTTTSGITASVSDLQTAQQTLTTTVDNLSVGGRNLFIAKNRANNKYINNDGVAGSWEKTILSDWIEVNPSTNYTVQVWQVPKTQAEIDDGESASFVIAQYDSNKAFISGTRRGNVCTTLNYKKDAFKTKTNAKYIRVHYHFGGPESSADWTPYGIHKIKVEEGNMPTGWSIAPEDVDSRITANANTASGIRNDLTSTQTQVTTNKNNIATLQTTTSSISANVSSLEETTTTLTTEMENMKIGARNLFIAKARTNDKFQKADGTTPTWAKTVMSDYISAEAGETYIAQAWKPANTSATGDNRGYIRFAYYNASKSLLSLASATGGRTPDNTCYFTGSYYWFKDKAPANTKFIRVIYHFGIDGTIGEDWDMFGDYKVKVEHGTKATEWSPAPEDMVDVIDRQYEELSSSFTMTTNQINSSVQQLTNNTTAVQRALNEYKSSNNSAIDDINGDIASVRQATELLQSKSEVQASVITELQNSQGKATQVTTTTATLNNSGLTVQKSSSTISTTISENGMQVKDGSTVELSANSQGVIAHNLSADNYLIVDNMIRWQKYGSNRIGCYWIGG